MLNDALQLEERFNSASPSTPLLGDIPELDSMAIVTVLTLLEEEFEIVVEDDEVTAELFRTIGTLVTYVERKVTP